MSYDREIARKILALPMDPNDSGASTVRGYLIALLHEVWTEQERFSGKRPFGNSGWDVDLWRPLIEAGLVKDACIVRNDDGHCEIQTDDWWKLEADCSVLIGNAIEELGHVE